LRQHECLPPLRVRLPLMDALLQAGCAAPWLIVYKTQVMMMHSDNNLSLILIETK
jgi:hypothetical protein